MGAHEDDPGRQHLYVKIAENSTDYSVMNTAKQMIWLPTTREEKYKAKQAIDTFFVRTGDKAMRVRACAAAA
jgi:ATP/ADP translocase